MAGRDLLRSVWMTMFRADYLVGWFPFTWEAWRWEYCDYNHSPHFIYKAIHDGP
jgi:hypothetical protein